MKPITEQDLPYKLEIKEGNNWFTIAEFADKQDAEDELATLKREARIINIGENNA
jgi:hypothetical protein